MPLENVATQDAVVGHGAGSVVTGGAFVLTLIMSTKSKILTRFIIKQMISFTFSGGNAPGCNAGSVTGSGTIIANGLKVKDFPFSGSQVVMRENDVGSGVFIGQTNNPTPPPPLIPVPLGSQPVKITSAGQIKVKGQ